MVAQVEEGLGLLGRQGAFAGDMVGNPDLFDDGGRSRGEHENAVGEEYGFLDVVGDEDDALPFDAVDLQQLVLEKLAGLSVERTEGLIHQEDIGPSRQRAGDGDTLAHAAGDAVDIKIGEIGQAHQVEIVAGDLVLFPGVDVFSVLGPETDVFEHGEPGKRGVSLKDHALFAVGTDDFLAGQIDLPARRGFQAANDAHQGRLAAARWAQVDREFAGGEIHRDVVDDPDRRVRGALCVEGLGDAGDPEKGGMLVHRGPA